MNIFNSVARELKYLSFSIKLLMRAGRVDKYRSETVADLIEKQIKKYPTNIAIEFEDKKYTYKELDAEANKIAHWATSKGYKKGDAGKRSIYVSSYIKSGEKISKKNIKIVRPGYGLPPRYFDEVIGKIALTDMSPGEKLKFDKLK